METMAEKKSVAENSVTALLHTKYRKEHGIEANRIAA